MANALFCPSRPIEPKARFEPDQRIGLPVPLYVHRIAVESVSPIATRSHDAHPIRRRSRSATNHRLPPLASSKGLKPMAGIRNLVLVLGDQLGEVGSAKRNPTRNGATAPMHSRTVSDGHRALSCRLTACGFQTIIRLFRYSFVSLWRSCENRQSDSTQWRARFPSRSADSYGLRHFENRRLP